MLAVVGDTGACNQNNALCWEHVNPPWVLPDYIGELAQALQDMKAWIATGGIAALVSMATGAPTPPDHASDGESKVGVSDVELPTPQKLLSKVQRADEVEHVLDKGLWAAMPAKHWGWQIFVDVSPSISFFLLLTHLGTQGKLVERDPRCQHCQTLRHQCYGLAEKFCSRFQQDKKTCQDMVVEGESLGSLPFVLLALTGR